MPLFAQTSELAFHQWRHLAEQFHGRLEAGFPPNIERKRISEFSREYVRASTNIWNEIFWIRAKLALIAWLANANTSWPRKRENSLSDPLSDTAAPAFAFRSYKRLIVGLDGGEKSLFKFAVLTVLIEKANKKVVKFRKIESDDEREDHLSIAIKMHIRRMLKNTIDVSKSSSPRRQSSGRRESLASATEFPDRVPWSHVGSNCPRLER